MPLRDLRPARRAGPAGETVRYYPRLPAGRVTYAEHFGPDGRLRAIEQRLSVEYFAKLIPGRSSKDDVRDLLGPPWRIDQFPRLMRAIWTYPTYGLPNLKKLYVQFSADGVVREVLWLDDPDMTRLPG